MRVVQTIAVVLLICTAIAPARAQDSLLDVVLKRAKIIVEDGKSDQLFFQPRTERVRQLLKRYNDRYRL